MTVGKNASKGDIPVDEGDWVYIELPYEGIYRGKNRLYEIISTQGEL